jgi:hypothetical protein
MAILFSDAEEFLDLAAELRKFGERARGPVADLSIPAGRNLEKSGEVAQALLGVFSRVRIRLGFFNALAQDGERRVNLAFFALVQHDAKCLPNVSERLKMIALVAHDVHELHDAPALEFLEAVADVGARDVQRVADLLGVERLR